MQFSTKGQKIPLNMVCSTKFGRYPKISSEQIWNMYNSDNFMVSYAGYRKILSITDDGEGRGIFTSIGGNFLLLIINNNVYTVDEFLKYKYIDSIDTYVGEVFIAENDAGQIGICDKQHIYIFNYKLSTFTKITTDFTPAHLSFQDGYFIAAVANEPKARLSALNDGTTWTADPENIIVLQAPDHVVATIPMPNIPNQLFLFGSSVTHSFNNVGNPPPYTPYSRNNSFSISYGAAFASTIAYSDKFIVWFGINPVSGATIMYTTGGQEQTIENEGLNFKFSQLNNPNNAYGFLFKQDGHLFYQLTFLDPKDNFSIAYDFNTKSFLNVSDYNQNYHPAKKIAFFYNKFYFISFNDGNLYEMSNNYFTYDGDTIPRIIIPPTIRMRDTTPFVVQNFYVLIEQGDEEEINYTDPLVNKGNISIPSDFPSPDDVVGGDNYSVLNPVDDDDPTKTNTGQKFGIGRIVWNETKQKWEVIREIASRVDLSLSHDGGATFGSYVSTTLKKEGNRKNIYNKWGLGRYNELTMQFRFYGKSKFVVSNGELNIYQ